MPNNSLKLALLAFAFITTQTTAAKQAHADQAAPPNFVIIFTDDQGYQDVGCFGASDIETPNLDQMAREGMRFTDFYVAQAVCSASRAALMTGCYSKRVSIQGAFGPKNKNGLNPDEITIAEVLKPLGYKTAIYGKWHLGDAEKFLPTNQGFDEYFGLPYSNDMWPYHPNVLHLPMEQRLKRWPKLPLYENTTIVDDEVTPEDQTHLTTWYTEHAVNFIERNKENPFFLYVPHSMPHVPLYVSDKFKGKSDRGLYGDVIMEIDWSVGQILDSLRKNGLEENTFVVFTSDNGPWLSYGNHAGSALPLREGKGTAWDGGQREPCIMWWPGTIPAGSECHEVTSTIDLLPTIAHLAGTEPPSDRIIDGKDITPLIKGEENATSPHEVFYFYWQSGLHAVRSGEWKLHFPHAYRSLKGEPGKDGLPGPYIQRNTDLALFNLSTDVGETTNVADEHPEVVERLKAYAEEARKDLGDALHKRKGENVRPIGVK
ncbi:sulfatase family protein [Calycomorphotria hydatis]|uniref:Arylsulfatase n=1 Tax=Calycomorphotria hydatis TaxID=2528027 RepID=A0A517T6I5_9PLAN|nr:sulfatase [Calycomorphotria hydatis]QDT63986.1 Arylsulfatase [Calycomorphotria hydatis]